MEEKTVHITDKTALLIIDVQEAFKDPRWGNRNNHDAEENMGRLLDAWRGAGLPVIHVRHMSKEPNSTLRPGTPGNEFQPRVAPKDGEIVVEKDVNSAFIGTRLRELLDERGIRSLITTGLTTNHCVSTTARMAGNFGYDTVVVGDACATFDVTTPDGKTIPAEVMHEVGLAELRGEFAAIETTDSVLEAMRHLS